MPIFIKSLAAPLLNKRSKKFPIPPEVIRANAINCIEFKPWAFTAYTNVMSSIEPTTSTKSTNRTSLGNFDPKLSMAPGFSVY
jgi:hypothetical protein